MNNEVVRKLATLDDRELQCWLKTIINQRVTAKLREDTRAAALLDSRDRRRLASAIAAALQLPFRHAILANRYRTFDWLKED